MHHGRLVVFGSVWALLACGSDSPAGPSSVAASDTTGSDITTTTGAPSTAPVPPSVPNTPDNIDLPDLPDDVTAVASLASPMQWDTTVAPTQLPTAMNFVTYEGSGQVVHPDWAAVPASWSSSRHSLVITPYPNGNVAYENPSLFRSTDGTNWSVPSGIANPLAQPADGYLSDPDQLFNPARNELWVYYRHVNTANDIFLIRSADGVKWTAPALVVSAINHAAISPSVVRRGFKDWWMWVVNAGSLGCGAASTTVELRKSADGVVWSAPQTVVLNQPGLFAWHIDVQWIPSRREFWAVYNAKVPGGCNTTALYLATSSDGVQWKTYPTPVLRAGVTPQFHDIVYRSTFAYNPVTDEVTFWYSGARMSGNQYIWGAATQRWSRTALFNQINTTGTPGLSMSKGIPTKTSATLALTNSTAP